MLAGASVLAVAYGYYLERTAKALLASVKALKIGESNFADATAIAQRYRRFRVYGNASVPASPDPAENRFPESVCTQERCFFQFIIDNRPLSTLHLVHGAAFTAMFAVLHGKVEYAQVYLVGGPSPGVNAGIVEEINPRVNRQPTYDFRTLIGSPYLRVTLIPSAPADIRDRAFAINMGCLLASWGCDKPCDYLPLAWTNWSAEVAKGSWVDIERARIPNCP